MPAHPTSNIILYYILRYEQFGKLAISETKRGLEHDDYRKLNPSAGAEKCSEPGGYNKTVHRSRLGGSPTPGVLATRDRVLRVYSSRWKLLRDDVVYILPIYIVLIFSLFTHNAKM